MKAIKKPIELDVWKLDKDDYNAPDWVTIAMITKNLSYELFGVWWIRADSECDYWSCAKDGDYLIKDEHERIYACKAEEFFKLYDIINT